MQDKDCALCIQPGIYGKGNKQMTALYKSAETHLLWMPEGHMSQAEMLKTFAYEKLMRDMVEFGEHQYPDGYQAVMNVGKYCSQPQHAHIHLLRHDGPHKAGNQGGVCCACAPFKRAHTV